jgi:hypothetical protein
MSNSRYPDNWSEIAFKVKSEAQWQCAKCGMQCLKSGDEKDFNRASSFEVRGQSSEVR